MSTNDNPSSIGNTPRLGVWKRTQANLLAGLILLLPLLITIFVLSWVFDLVAGPAFHLLEKSVPLEWREGTLTQFLLKVGLIVLFTAFILVLGTLTRFVFGRRIFGGLENVILTIPGISRLYGGVKQIIDAFSAGQAGFRRVVLVRFPTETSWSIGFVTREGLEEAERRLGRKVLNVFVPTTPNPTSGFLLIVPEDDLIPLEMTVERGIKLVISGGTVSPPARPDPLR